MKRTGKAGKGLAVVFLITAVMLVIGILIWIFLTAQTDQLRKGYIEGIVKDNEYIVHSMADRIAEEAADESEAAEIIEAAPPSGTRYWFLLSSDAVVFERDAAVTAKVASMSYSDLEDYYIRNGGSGARKLVELINLGEDFSAVVTKDSALGSEIISAVFIEIGGERFCIGTSVLQSYMFSTAKIGERIFILRTMTLLLCLVLAALTSYFASVNYRKTLKIHKLQDELKDKNIHVQEQEKRLSDAYSDDANKSNDAFTGLYNRKFFDAVTAKLSERNAEKIGIIFIRIDNLAKLKSDKGYAFANQLIMETADSLKKHGTAKDICARIRVNVFAVISLDTTNRLTLQHQKKLLNELKALYPDAIVTAGSSYRSETSTFDAALVEAWSSLNEIVGKAGVIQ